MVLTTLRPVSASRTIHGTYEAAMDPEAPFSPANNDRWAGWCSELVTAVNVNKDAREKAVAGGYQIQSGLPIYMEDAETSTTGCTSTSTRRSAIWPTTVV